MKSLSKPLSWSPARSRSFNQCGLKYYISYILAPQGWKPDAAEDARTAYKLGHISNLKLEVGTQAHLAIKRILEKRIKGMPISPQWEAENAAGLFKMWIERSAAMSWSDLGWGRTQLDIHFDGKTLAPADIEDGLLELHSCLSGFFSSKPGRHLLARPDLILAQMLDPQEFKTVIVDDVPLITRTDAVIRGNKTLEILDWKSGRPHHSHQQSAILQEIYVRGAYNVPADWRVLNTHVYLQDSAFTTFEASEDQKSDLINQARDEVALMQEDQDRLVLGESPLKVLPPRPGPAVCRFCAYKKVCAWAKL